jgi:hypothetical protein
MKRLAMSSVAVLVLLAMTGCPIQPGLVGVWEMSYSVDNSPRQETWTFYDDGTFEWVSADGENWGDGTYTQDGNDVVAVESFDDDGNGVNEGAVRTELTLGEDGVSISGNLVQTLNGTEDLDVAITGTKV